MKKWYSTVDGTGKILATLFVAALLLRLVFLISGVLTEGSRYYMTYSDSHGYVTIAQNLISGNGFSMAEEPPFEKDSIRIPGYPFFLVLSLLLGSLWPAIAAQVLLRAATT